MSRTCLLIALIVASTAVAQGGGRRNPDALFERYDKNGDGKLTADELPERAQRMIERMDKNGDGVLTKDEVSARGGRRGSDEKFKNSAPRVGDPLPDIAVYDAKGATLKLRSLKGKPTVLVFGCLT
ncbi:MAG: hypothetical protein ACYTGZ_13810 [Planctomycetota bacterium]|jgi:hypothetical protein